MVGEVNIGSVLKMAIVLSRQDGKALPPFVKTTKMQEEAGELCEAVLQNHGYVAANKAGVGTVMEESADMFLQVIDILQEEHKHLSPDELTHFLCGMLRVKLAKWVEKKMDLPDGVYYAAEQELLNGKA